MFENLDALHEMLLEVLAEGSDLDLAEWVELFCQENKIELDKP